MPVASISWNASVPIRFERTWPGDADERRRVHPRVRDRRHEVRRAGARRRDRDADATRRTRVALGHVAGALLVPREHVADRRARARSRRRSGGSRRRDAERDVDALGLEGAEDRVGAEHPRHAHTSSKSSTSVRALRQSAITASVNARVPSAPGRSAHDLADARSSVRARASAPSPRRGAARR
jgi:hypothetical protein